MMYRILTALLSSLLALYFTSRHLRLSYLCAPLSDTQTYASNTSLLSFFRDSRARAEMFRMVRGEFNVTNNTGLGILKSETLVHKMECGREDGTVFSPRRLLLLRHAERFDRAIGKHVVNEVGKDIKQSGTFRQVDLNFPNEILKQADTQMYIAHSSLSLVGHFHSHLAGRYLRSTGVEMTAVYSCPLLRCVQSAHELLLGYGTDLTISIEFGIIEYLKWFNPMMHFMNATEAAELGYPVNLSYTSIHPYRASYKESLSEYYSRGFNVTKEILRRHPQEGATILLIGSASTLEVCSRYLMGKPIRAQKAFLSINAYVPFGSMTSVQESCTERDRWFPIPPPLPPFTHGAGSPINTHFFD